VAEAEIKTAWSRCSEADRRRDNNEEAKKKDKTGVVIEVSLRCCDG
jgi:hypothetical protein